jgi:hypothetical protein
MVVTEVVSAGRIRLKEALTVASRTVVYISLSTHGVGYDLKNEAKRGRFTGRPQSNFLLFPLVPGPWSFKGWIRLSFTASASQIGMLGQVVFESPRHTQRR